MHNLHLVFPYAKPNTLQPKCVSFAQGLHTQAWLCYLSGNTTVLWNFGLSGVTCGFLLWLTLTLSFLSSVSGLGSRTFSLTDPSLKMSPKPMPRTFLGWAITPLPEAGWGDVGVGVLSIPLPSGEEIGQDEGYRTCRLQSCRLHDVSCEIHMLFTFKPPEGARFVIMRTDI